MSKMLEETRQQPEALTKTLEGGLRSIFELRHHFEQHRPRMIVMVARGTSDNAAQFGRYLIEITTRIPVSLAAPSILTLYESPLDLRDVLVVGISQAGGEKSVAATKTYTCQLLMVYLLAYALAGDVQLDDLRRVPEWVDAALSLEEHIEDLAERYFFMTRAVTVGRGLNYANALEFGLKLMETCYVVTERFSAADLMHGPIALVERAFPVFVFAPSGVTWPSISAVLDRLRELKAETLIITDESNAAARSKAARLIQLPAQFKT